MTYNYACYYLGANTPQGFRSLFERSYSGDDWRVYIIKGGPGTGKSTLMKKICERAEQAGEYYEKIFCSSDPSSLDAVILPERRRAIFDGTAPHVLEPKLPGACEQIINLGTAWDERLLFERREDIARYSKKCSAHHARAMSLLGCAAVFRNDVISRIGTHINKEKIMRAAERLGYGICAKSQSKAGEEKLRLATAVTPLGVLNVAKEHIGGYERIVPIYDRTWAAGGMLLESVREILLARGCSIIFCPCSQEHSRIEHILVPECGVCITTRTDVHGEKLGDEARAIHTDRFMPSGLLKENRNMLEQAKREVLRFTELAASEMRSAKAVHDLLEEQYRSAMDFDMVDELAHSTADRIFG